MFYPPRQMRKREWLPRNPRKRKNLIAAVLLGVVIAAEWGASYDVFRSQPLLSPISYWGDAQCTGALVAAGKRGDFVPFLPKSIDSLGAPGIANWDDFPLNEDLLYFGVGTLARVVGVFGAINLAFLFACIAAGVSMFLVARYFRAGLPGAFLAGQLYALCGFMSSRNVQHFSLCFYFFLPWLVQVAMWLASRRGIELKSPRFKRAALVMLVVSWSMIYFMYFAAQVVGLAVLAGWAKNGFKQWRTWVALAGITLAGTVSMQADSLWRRHVEGTNASVASRDPHDVERFALKPITFVGIAPNATDPVRKGIAGAYGAESILPGEAPSPYMGLFGFAAFVVMLGYLVVKLSRGELDRRAGWAVMAVAITALNGVGGLNSFLGLAGFSSFRSSNRASIVVFTYVMLFLAWGFAYATKRLPRAAQWALVLVLGPFSVWDSNHGPMGGDEQRLVLFESDKALVAEAERLLQPGARVYSLPVHDFPESWGGGVDAYEMFRPYFHANHLVFSHGAMKGRPQNDWQHEVEKLPLPEMFAELKRNGFSAIYINLRPYGGVGALSKFQQAGATVLSVAQAKDSAFIALP